LPCSFWSESFPWKIYGVKNYKSFKEIVELEKRKKCSSFFKNFSIAYASVGRGSASFSIMIWFGPLFKNIWILPVL